MSTVVQTRSFASRLRAAFAANPARARVVFLVVLALVVLGMSLKYAAKIEKPGDGGLQSRSAFLRWRTMIHEIFAGTNVYVGVHEYPNPPIMAVVLKPFADLPPTTGALAWFYAKVLMVCVAAVWVFRLFGGKNPSPSPSPKRGGETDGTPTSLAGKGAGGLGTADPSPSPSPKRGGESDTTPPSLAGKGAGGLGFPDTAKAIAIVLALPPLLGDLSHNNVNIFILFLIAGCLEAYRRGWDIASGLVLGLAIACKVTPLMFLAFFLYKRAGKVVAGCVLGLALWLVVVPGAIFGWERNLELLESWNSLMVKPALVDNRVTSEHPNQSIPGVVFRLFTHSPSFVVYPDNIPTPAAFHNFADIGTDAARWVVKGCLVGFALVILLLCRAPRIERQGWRFAAECSLIVLGMLLFSERTWKHHAVTLLLPFATIVYCAFNEGFSRRIRRWLIAVLVGVSVLTNLPGVLPPRASDLAMVYGSYTVAFLLLTVGIATILRQTRDRRSISEAR